MSEPMDKWRHMDGSDAILDRPYIRIVFQHGDPKARGINGCRIEHVIEALQDKLLDFQGRDLACDENARALYHLEAARDALVQRRRARERQGVIGTGRRHASPLANPVGSEDEESPAHLS